MIRYLALLLLIFSVSASAQDFQVPAKEDQLFYASRQSIHFQVCSPNLEIPSKWAAGQWNKLGFTPHISISLNCKEHGRGNNQSEIYAFTHRDSFVGRYIRYDDGEEDIVIQVERIPDKQQLRQTILHELGHALGLEDAYAVYSQNCDSRSVMFAVCKSIPILNPTPFDVAALRKVYPEKEEIQSLTEFDENRNKRLDDPEFFNLVDAWVEDRVDNKLFMRGLDAWIEDSFIRGKSLSLKEARFIDIYGLGGRKIKRLHPHQLKAWKRQEDPGIYLYKAHFPSGVKTGKLAIIN